MKGLNNDNVGVYAGIIFTSFMLAKGLTSYPLGKMADAYGRKFVLVISLVFSGIFSIAFGLSTSFTWAVITRFLLGLNCAFTAILFTWVIELSEGNKEKEMKSMGSIMKVWGLGFNISPILSGFLSAPRRQYPKICEFLFMGKAEQILTTFPYLLPNAIGTILCIISAILIATCVEETVPRDIRNDPKFIIRDFCSWLSRKICKKKRKELYSATSEVASSKIDDLGKNDEMCYYWVENEPEDVAMLFPSDSSRQYYDAAFRRSVSLPENNTSEESTLLPPDAAKKQRAACYSDVREEEMTLLSIAYKYLLKKKIRRHLVTLWVVSFVNSSVEIAFPLFCMAKGGLNVSEKHIGTMISFAGISFNSTIDKIFAAMMKKCHVYTSLKIAIVLTILPSMLVPVSIPLNKNAEVGEITVKALVFLVILFALLRIFSAIFTADMTISLSESVSLKHRAQINGLASSGTSITKAISPIFVGYLVVACLTSERISPQLGSVVIFLVLTCIGSIAVFLTFFLSRAYEPCVKTEY